MPLRRLKRFCLTLWQKHRLAIVLYTVAGGVLLFAFLYSGLTEVSWKFCKDHWKFLMDAIGVVALLLAVFAHFALVRLREEISTKYIGRFPEHLREIRRLVSGAVIRIDSMADCVDYGSFFSPKAHEMLMQQLITARDVREVPIRMLICGGGPKAISAASSFGEDTPVERVNKPEFREDLKRYLHVLVEEGSLPDKEDRNKVGFKKFLDDISVINRLAECEKTGQFKQDDCTALETLLLARHDWFLERLTKSSTVLVRTHPLRSDVFLWISWCNILSVNSIRIDRA